ncbi:MAG: acylphosphatase [Gammaproteobacteria bacterium]|nr:acylphosphatase [Gammaproteobacteria bacterium]
MNDNANFACIRCTVSGKVQGVFFRTSAQNQAQLLGIVGHAKNLSDGRVEVIACGQLEALDGLKKWLHTGPSTAVVSNVECESLAQQKFSNFQTL